MGRSGLILGSALAAGVGTAAYMVVARPKAVAPFRFSFFRYLRPHARPTFVAAAAMGAAQTGLTIMPNQYPQVRRDPKVVDVLHGVSVADPYRWLEDPDSEETTKFVEAQNALTKTALDQCDTRSKFIDLFTAVFDYPKFGTPFRSGKRYYYYHNSGLQAQYVLMSQAALGAEASVLLDPNTLSEDGTISLSGMAFSDCGTYLSYSLSSGGSDWSEIQVMSIDQATGKTTELSDKLEFVKFSSMAWTHDAKGFFYNRYPDPKNIKDLGTETETNTDQMLCYHVLGTNQSEDTLVMAMPDHPTWMMGAEVTDDGRYILLTVSEGCVPANHIYYVDMQKLEKKVDGGVDFTAHDFKTGKKKLPVVKLVENFEASYSCVANDGSTFYFKTNLNAPRYKIVKADITKPGPPSTWVDVVPHHEKDVLKSAMAIKGDNLITRYLRDVTGALQLRSLATGELKKEFPLPGVGSIPGASGERKYSEFFFSFQSFTEPGAQYRVDLEKAGEEDPTLFRRTELKVAHNPSEYETNQVFVASKDGTKVPIFITHKKGIKRDGSNPTLLYGYGGFNISLEPGFSASRLSFMKGYGGVYVQANIRGGGEYGVDWRNAGSKENKQNVFDDFQAVAEYLIKEGFCSSKKLAIQGGSNGGLLVAACANQRPDLYACVIGQVGVMDMLRFHKFTIGHAWTTDYGSADNLKDFEYILPYSPLHNVRVPEEGKGQYPAIMLATGDHDDRVVPLHSFKLIAELQHTLALAPAVASQRNPLLIRIEVRAGHGAGKPTKKVIEETADLISFATKCMDAKWVDSSSSL